MINKLSRNIKRNLLNSYKLSKQRSANNSLNHCLKVTHETLKHTKYCFLISRGLNGWSSARFVEPICERDLSVFWVGTNPELRKIKEIQSNPKITLAFGNSQERANIVIYGEAYLENDITLRKKYWKGEWRLFFPSGPTGDEYVLIKIVPLRMEIMSFQRNIIQEPFGLKPIVLKFQNSSWILDTSSN